MAYTHVKLLLSAYKYINERKHQTNKRIIGQFDLLSQSIFTSTWKYWKCANTKSVARAQNEGKQGGMAKIKKQMKAEHHSRKKNRWSQTTQQNAKNNNKYINRRRRKNPCRSISRKRSTAKAKNWGVVKMLENVFCNFLFHNFFAFCVVIFS